VVEGRELKLGSSRFVTSDQHFQNHADAVLLADQTSVLAAFYVGEQLRPGMRDVIDALKAQGLQLHILSGDAPTKVADIAARLGIESWQARTSPADKLSQLGALRAQGARVLVVGDGVNDAPVLASADVGVALASGAEIARASSDIVLAGERLSALVMARRIARETVRVIQQNQRWALMYNLVAMPLAALGFVPPWLAALGMSFSSLCVIANALRIGRDAARVEVPARASLHAAPRAA
jgi:Cu2+-exporting ATPase